MRSKEVDLAIKNFENYDKLISIYRPKDVTIENPQDFNKDVETVLKYISELEAKLEFKQFGDLDNAEFENLYISTDKIRDKIKELEEERRIIESSPYDKWDLYKVIGKIEVLKSIIGE